MYPHGTWLRSSVGPYSQVKHQAFGRDLEEGGVWNVREINERRNSLRIYKLYPGFHHHQSRDADSRGGERQAHLRLQVVARPLRRACLCHPAASTTPAAKSNVTAAAQLSIPSEEDEAARNALPADRSPPGGAASRSTTAPSSCR